ncbi:3758_t:CDS:2, partial [Paraglomus brasilianum]
MSNYVFMDDPFSTKRQRCQMACVFCRQRKIKCDGLNPSCASCRRHNMECKYQPIKKDAESVPNSNKSQGLTSTVLTTPSNSIANASAPKRRRIKPSRQREQQIEAQGAVYHNGDITADIRGSQKRPINENTEYPITASHWDYVDTQRDPKFEEVLSNEYDNELLEKYWIHVHPQVPILNKKLFKDPLNPPTLLLLEAMYAISALFSENTTNADSLHFERAEALLGPFLDAPRISTIQALILLCVFKRHQQYSKKDNIPEYPTFQEKLYISMAIKMAFELGLSKSRADSILSVAEKELRKRIWWSLFLLDVFISWENCESNINEDDFDVAECELETDEMELTENGSLVKFAHNVRFARLLHRLTKHIYSNQSGTSYDESIVAIIANFESQLNDWSQYLRIIDDDMQLLHLHCATQLCHTLLRSPLRTITSCITWCLLQTGKVHAWNIFSCKGDISTAERYYKLTIELLKQFKLDHVIQALEDYRKTCHDSQLIFSEQSSPHSQNHFDATTENDDIMDITIPSNDFSDYHYTSYQSSSSDSGTDTQSQFIGNEPHVNGMQPLNVSMESQLYATPKLSPNSPTDWSSPNTLCDYVSPFPVLGTPQGASTANFLYWEPDLSQSPSGEIYVSNELDGRFSPTTSPLASPPHDKEYNNGEENEIRAVRENGNLNGDLRYEFADTKRFDEHDVYHFAG